MKIKASQNAHRGSDFRDFLAGEGVLTEVEVLALKRVVSLQLQQILEQEHGIKTEPASRMKTNRASLDRMLDSSIPSLTVASLGKAAAALGRKVELRFMPLLKVQSGAIELTYFPSTKPSSGVDW